MFLDLQPVLMNSMDNILMELLNLLQSKETIDQVSYPVLVLAILNIGKKKRKLSYPKWKGKILDGTYHYVGMKPVCPIFLTTLIRIRQLAFNVMTSIIK